MNEPVKVSYRGIEITYLENTDRWQFELRGRERSADTLQKAKQAIDAPEPREKKPFQRFKAWTVDGYATFNWKIVEVTSIAESLYGSIPELWCMIPPDKDESQGRNRRQKIMQHYLFPIGGKNDELVAEQMKLTEQAKALRKQAEALKEKMQHYEVPEESTKPSG